MKRKIDYLKFEQEKIKHFSNEKSNFAALSFSAGANVLNFTGSALIAGRNWIPLAILLAVSNSANSVGTALFSFFLIFGSAFTAIFALGVVNYLIKAGDDAALKDLGSKGITIESIRTKAGALGGQLKHMVLAGELPMHEAIPNLIMQLYRAAGEVLDLNPESTAREEIELEIAKRADEARKLGRKYNPLATLKEKSES